MLRPVERDNLSTQVFRQLRDDILLEEYRPGDRLPSERELCDILCVNRSSVREALKRLEQARLIQIRHGGGSIVLDFRLNAGFDLLRDLVMPAGNLDLITIRSILEFRTLLSTEVARYAAQRIQPPELERLEKLVDKIEACTDDEVERFQRLDFQFHYTMTRASENLAFVLLLNSIKDVYLAHKAFFEVMFVEGIKERDLYRRIVEALSEHDAERSRSFCEALIEIGNRIFWDTFRRANPTADVKL